MIELVFIACLASQPADCRSETLLFTDATPLECLLRAQGELALWAERHPTWRIGRWSCAAQDRRSART